MLELSDKLKNIKYSLIRKFSDLVKTDPNAISLAIGEPDFDTPLPIKKACIKALNDGLTHYAPSKGNADLINAICQYEKTCTLAYNQNEVIVTAGSTEGLTAALFTLINPKDEIILPTPTYPHYRPIIELCGGGVCPIDTTSDHFQITREKLESAYTSKTKALIINTPNNPTGVVYNQKTMNAIIDFVIEKNIYLLFDNIYELLKFPDKRCIARLDKIKDRLIICKSFSKPYCMTGWRLGYLLGPEFFINECGKIHSYFTTAINTFIQPAGIVALSYDTSELNHIFEKRRDYIYKRLTKMGLDVIKPQGGFYIFPDIKKFGLTSTAFCEQIFEEEKLAIIPGIAFETEGFIRLSFCLKMPQLIEAMDRFEHFIKKFK